MCLIVSYYIDQLVVSLSIISFAIPSLIGVKKVGKVSLSYRCWRSLFLVPFSAGRSGSATKICGVALPTSSGVCIEENSFITVPS